MKKGLFILFVMVNANAFAQTTKVLDNVKGHWDVIHLSDQILKCTYTPNGYTKNEQVSNAVNFLDSKTNSKKELWKLETTNSQEMVQRFVFDEQKSFPCKHIVLKKDIILWVFLWKQVNKFLVLVSAVCQ